MTGYLTIIGGGIMVLLGIFFGNKAMHSRHRSQYSDNVGSFFGGFIGSVVYTILSLSIFNTGCVVFAMGFMLLK